MYYVSDFTNKIQKHSTITTFSFEKVVDVLWSLHIANPIMYVYLSKKNILAEKKTHMDFN